MKHSVEQTLAFAKQAHRNQRDKGGHPYFDHVSRVVDGARDLVEALPPGLISGDQVDEILMVAALHDVFEDEEFTGYGLKDLEAMSFPARVEKAVKRLCGRPEGVSYQQNIENIAAEGDLYAIIPKLADNRDNSLPWRIEQLEPKKRSIIQRYDRARPVLERALIQIINTVQAR